jgi:hypothetical protein
MDRTVWRRPLGSVLTGEETNGSTISHSLIRGGRVSPGHRGLHGHQRSRSDFRRGGLLSGGELRCLGPRRDGRRLRQGAGRGAGRHGARWRPRGRKLQGRRNGLDCRRRRRRRAGGRRLRDRGSGLRRRLPGERQQELRHVRPRLHQPSARGGRRDVWRWRRLLFPSVVVRGRLDALQHQPRRGLRDRHLDDVELRRLRQPVQREHAGMRGLRVDVPMRVRLPPRHAHALHWLVRRHDEQRQRLQDMRQRLHDDGLPCTGHVRGQRVQLLVQRRLHGVQRGLRRRDERQCQLRRMRQRVHRRETVHRQLVPVSERDTPLRLIVRGG